MSLVFCSISPAFVYPFGIRCVALLCCWFATQHSGKFKSPSSAWGLTGAKIIP